MMNERFKLLKKRIIGSGIKAAIMIGGCAACFAVAFYFYQNQSENLKRMETKKRQAQGEVSQLQARIERTNNSMELYNNLIKESKLRKLGLSRKAISILLTRLSEPYRISDVLINIAPLTEQKADQFMPKTGKIITSTITLKYKAISDVHAFLFIEKLFNDFSGYININSFSIRRDSNIEEKNLREILQTGKTSFVDVNIEFEWLGLRPNPSEEVVVR